jgi:hypothetical protein
MSLDIHKFIEQIVKTDLPKFAATNLYLGAGVLAGGIEFMGACIDSHPVAVERQSAARFCLALNEFFPTSYHKFSRPAPYTKAVAPTQDLYSCLRCGMAHVMRPQGVLLTGTTREAKADGHTHLKILNRGGIDRPLIVVEQFSKHFVAAVTKLQKRLKASPLPPKLQGDFLTVWPS